MKDNVVVLPVDIVMLLGGRNIIADGRKSVWFRDFLFSFSSSRVVLSRWRRRRIDKPRTASERGVKKKVVGEYIDN